MKTMQKLAVIVLGVVMLSATFVGVTSASQAPFSAETNYMSLAGFNRYLNYQQTNVWTHIFPQKGG